MNLATTASLVGSFIGKKLGFDMNNEIIDTCNDENVPITLMRKLYELQKIGELCDCELKTECGSSFKVHKWVVSAVSKFFNRLFSDTGFIDNKTDSITIPHASAEILEKIIEYMYTGKIEISSKTAKNIMDCALFLGLPTLIGHCSKILIKTLNDKNCLELLKYSETCVHFGTELTKKSLELVCKDFEKFVKRPYFCDLSSETMKILVEQDRFSYREEDLYLAVRKWITYDLEKREQFIPSLINKIHFKYFSPHFSQSCVLHNNPLMKRTSFKETLIKSLDDFWSSKIKNVEKNLYAIHGANIFRYNFCNQRFSNIITTIEGNGKYYGYTTFNENKIFICSDKVCKYFSMLENSWHDLPSRKHKTISPKVISFHGKIYIVGGNEDNSNERSIEVLDINKSEWSDISGFEKFDCNAFDVAYLNNSIYIIDKDCVQRLDLKSNVWEILNKLEDKNTEEIYSVEIYNDKIYGFSLKGISTFDIRNKKWLELRKLYKESYENIGQTCVMNDSIYVLGKCELRNNEYCLQTFDLTDLTLQSSSYVRKIFNSNFNLVGLFSI